ncbi:tryptophan synthase subunit alpha [Elizabethkingia anophelis]|uniref:Tryptophan synthase alpha chain n=1 Tax=Elizabethkingia anophelis R26 TaxID=1246994 RepID=A0ABM6MPJ8_9FLAO|nr:MULTISPECIES: tryptophan synthase subunit alpha [Elizabethkingia]AQW92311.1 tryptophan synthase subunit alpha [Elizabethkingia anophelis]ATC34999.1 tryptophan synthase subunit alpha [Elizabethkingia anophelis R26]ATC38640.1 tryptophan synthase subunit alpha [Elizabethkingia anophelis Ag1]ATC42320.1 tryptophan synthase subunit alpha [Elizabethkingia anophelis]ATC45996.1 tryptophan synthase subunit alpha [Elizabethkingia anophelis]
MKKLNIYFTAGVPQLNDTAQIMKTIQSAGADMIEVGIPYSDPVADGPVIQKSDELALQNGMTIAKLFEQLKTVKDEINIPVILMGYLNPVLKFGFEKFCQECQASGISGLILPDLPPIEFEKKYQKILEQYGINFTFLVTPETSDERIQYLDSLSSGFLYAVSSSSTTGTNQEIDNDAYFKRLKSLNLKNQVLIGFSIKNKADFDKVTQHADGAIIGSAFVKILLENQEWESKAAEFIKSIK